MTGIYFFHTFGGGESLETLGRLDGSSRGYRSSARLAFGDSLGSLRYPSAGMPLPGHRIASLRCPPGLHRWYGEFGFECFLTNIS